MKDFSDHDIAMMDDWSVLREAKGLSLKAIADETNIPIKKLTAIEKHAFGDLGPETFAMGYLRTYAKYIGENAEVFIQVYRDAVSPEEPVLAQTHVGLVVEPVKRTFQKLNVMQMSIGVIVIWVVAMLLLSGGDEDERSSDSSSQPSTVMEESPPVYEGEFAETNADDQIADSSTEQERPKALNSNNLPVADDVTDEVLSAISAAESSAHEEAQVSTPTEGSNTTTSADGDDLLVLTFTGDCWLEVKDATGAMLIAELQRKGDNQRVFGQAPFEVMLGNARATTLTFNGEVVSTTPPAGRKTLRFTVPQ